MKLSTKSRYGTRAMMDIAIHSSTGPSMLKDISRRQNISPKYLDHILSTLRKAGLIKEDEALDHEDLHEISNVIGISDMRMEIGSKIPMAPLDTLLLASDGLFDNVLPDEIIEIIRTGPVATGAAELCRLALDRMYREQKGKPSKPDDFSAILYRQSAQGD